MVAVCAARYFLYCRRRSLHCSLLTTHYSLFASNRLDLYEKTNVKCTSSFFTFYLIPQLCRFFVAFRGDEIRKFAFHLR